MEHLTNFLTSRDALLLLYVLTVISLGFWALSSIYRWLRWLTKLRKKRLKSRGPFEAIPTDTPLDDPAKVAKARGMRSIESHFTITRKLLLPGFAAVILTISLIPILDQFPAAVLSLVIGAATVVVGVAAKPIIENLFAGLVIASSRVLHIGDTIKLDDIYGTIEDITPAYTTIKVWDWRRCVVPNSRMLDSQFLNYTLNDNFIWSYVEFWVAYNSDIHLVEKLAIEAAKNSPCFAPHEDPSFWVMEMSKEGLRCWIAAWSEGPNDAWNLKNDIRTGLIKDFAKHGVDSHGFNHDLRGLGGAGRGMNFQNFKEEG